jgi:hypothetical protein
LKLRRNIFYSLKDFGLFFALSFNEHDIDYNVFYACYKTVGNYHNLNNIMVNDAEPKFIDENFVNPKKGNFKLSDGFLKSQEYGIIYDYGVLKK